MLRLLSLDLEAAYLTSLFFLTLRNVTSGKELVVCFQRMHYQLLRFLDEGAWSGMRVFRIISRYFASPMPDLLGRARLPGSL